MEIGPKQTPLTHPSARVLWVDLARGLGILLVVLGHVNRGLYDAELHSSSQLYRSLDDGLYLFHMPLFFMLSGLFMTQTVRKVGVSAFVASRLRTLAYPAVLWTWLLGLAQLTVGPAANHPPSLNDFPLLPFPPYSLYWFLWALLLNQVALAPLITRIDFHSPIHRGRLIALSLGCWAVAHLLEQTEGFAWSAKIPFHLPFILAGAAFRQLAPRPSFATALSALAALLVAELYSPALIQDPLLKPLGGLIAAGALMHVARACAQHPTTHPATMGRLAGLGRESMAIYLSHVLFTAAARAILTHLQVESLTAHMLTGLSLGIAASWFLARTAKRFHVDRLLGIA